MIWWPIAGRPVHPHRHFGWCGFANVFFLLALPGEKKLTLSTASIPQLAAPKAAAKHYVLLQRCSIIITITLLIHIMIINAVPMHRCRTEHLDEFLTFCRHSEWNLLFPQQNISSFYRTFSYKNMKPSNLKINERDQWSIFFVFL